MIQKRGNVDVLLIVFIVALLTALGLFFIASSDLLLVLSVFILVVGIIFGIVDVYIRFFSKTHKMRKAVKQLEQMANLGNVDELKMKYNDLYSLYMKLSESGKRNFYGKVMKLREQIEEFLKTKKKLEVLLEKSKILSVQQRQQKMQEIIALQQKLPLKEQENFQMQIVHLKN